jgi:hypothetical protein
MAKTVFIKFLYNKIFCICCTALLCCTRIEAQVNLISDPSFEDTMSTYSYWVHKCLHKWRTLDSLRPFNGETSYFSHFSKLASGQIPNLYFQVVQPRNGSAYIGLTDYWIQSFSPPNTSVRSVARTHLTSRLMSGKKYCAKMYVSASTELAARYTNGIGMYFDNGQLDTIVKKDSSGMYPFVKPQLFSAAVVSDTSNWVLVSNTFIANGTEQFATIGNFIHDTDLTVVHVIWPPNATFDCECADVAVDDVMLIATDIAQWLSDTTVAINDSVTIGLGKWEVVDAQWYALGSSVPIGQGAHLRIKAAQPVQQYVQAIDVCDGIRYDTVAVYAYPLATTQFSISSADVKVLPTNNASLYNVTVSDKLVGQQLTVQDASGKVLIQRKAQATNEIWLQGVATGIYFVRVAGVAKRIYVMND